SALQAQREALELDSCMLRIPAQSFKRVPVFIQATSQGKSSAGIMPLADLFAQTAAIKMRELLGNGSGQLPEADSVVAWYGIYGEVDVTVKKDGTFSWLTAEWSRSADTLARSSIKMIDRTLTELAKEGEKVGWPDASSADSLGFSLSLTAPRVSKAMKVEPMEARQAFPAFSLLMPWASAVDYKKYPMIRFPNGFQIGKVVSARLTFVIDKSGKVDISTVKEFSIPGQPRLMGEDRRRQNDFIDSVKDALRSAKYKPANIGGCVVKQTVQQEFSFQRN
ncbi:MAG TPA: hypothetical protein VF042_13315, partial [Gemmatimonadaceae bacterium]